MTILLDIPKDRRRPGRWQVPFLAVLIALFFLILQGEAKGPGHDPASDRETPHRLGV